MDKAEELFGAPVTAEDAAPVATVPEAPAEVVTEPVTAPELPQPPQPEPAPDTAKQEHHVPLPKYLDVRDENKELKRRIAEFEGKQQAPKAPDPIDDPEGFTKHVERIAEAKATATKFETSDVIARQAHGADVVDAAADWALARAKSDPTFAAQYMREPHPIDWIVRQHKRDAMLTEIGDDPNDWFTREAAKRGYVPQSAPPAAEAQAQAVTAQSVPTPTPSLVNVPSTGGIAAVATGPTAALETVFPR